MKIFTPIAIEDNDDQEYTCTALVAPGTAIPVTDEEQDMTDLFIELDRYYLDGLLSGDDYVRILAGKVV